MFGVTQFGAVSSIGAALGNIRSAALTAGWHEDKYANKELYIHSPAGLHYSLSVQSDPYKSDLAHITLCGNTGFDSAKSWFNQPGRYSLMAHEQRGQRKYNKNVVLPPGVGPMQYREGQGQPTGYALSALWLLCPLDMWVVANEDNIYVFFAAKGYGITGVNDKLCVCLWLGRINRYDPTAGGVHGGAICLSDQVAANYKQLINGYKSDVCASMSCLSGAMPPVVDYHTRTDLHWYGEFDFEWRHEFTHNRGLLWEGQNISEDKTRISSHIAPDWPQFVSYNWNADSKYKPLTTIWDKECIKTPMPKQYNSVYDRPILSRPIVQAAVDDQIHPIGETPHWLIRDYKGIVPGSIAQYGSHEYITFPIFADHPKQYTGAALRVK